MESVFDYTSHKELWNWIAKNPDKGKTEWPGWKTHIKGEYGCFACNACDYDFTEIISDHCSDECIDRNSLTEEEAESIAIDFCEEHCPLFVKCCWKKGELYSRYTTAQKRKDFKEIVTVANEIANLPVRKDWCGEVI